MSDTERLARNHGIPPHEVNRLMAVASGSGDVQFGSRKRRKPHVPTPPPKSEQKRED